MKFVKFARSTASFAVLAAVACSGAAFAQDEDEARTVDEIVVTAQKREQNLQDVPVVVTALSERLLQDNGVKDIKDLQVLTPGLNVTSTSNETNTTVRIRGVGTVGDNPGLESSVSVVIDGVYRPRNGVAFNDLGELERIEVLKGPQGTLFGKNTSAGVVNVMTKAPSFDFGGSAELTAGNYGTIGGSASVTGAIVEDKLAGRLFFAKRQRDGLYDIRTGDGPRTRTDDADQNYYTARGQLLFTPTSDLDVRVIADFTKRDESCCVGVQIVNSTTAGIIDALAADEGLANPARPFDRVSYANRDTDQRIEEKGVSAEVTWDTPWLGGATLTSITAGRNWRTENGQDSDFTTADIVYRPADGRWSTEFAQFSQELRLAGRNERVDWLVGMFYAKEDLDQSTPFFYGTDYETYLSLALSGGTNPLLVSQLSGLPVGTSYTAGSGLMDRYAQTSDSLAFFTNNTVHLTDRLDLTIGLRHTSESKELKADYDNLAGNNGCAAILNRVGTGAVPNPGTTALGLICLPWAAPGFDNYSAPRQSRDEKEWTGTAKLSFDVTDDVMTYVSYAKGYKAGGYNLDRARVASGPTPFSTLTDPEPNTSFAPEFVQSWELGAKTSWLGRTLSLNTALFHQTFTDFQLNTFTGLSYLVVSIPEVVSMGVDMDLLWFTPIDGLSLQGGVTYAETEYGDFVPPAGVSARLPDARLSFAPLWSASLATSYERDLGSSLKLRGGLAAKYSSSYNTGSDLAPQKMQDAFTLVNGRIGIGEIDDRWAVELWAQNLTDVEYYQVAYDATLQTGSYDAFLGAPRTYGITLRSRF